ncbi:unnamed protein product [Cyprideis torosa]|uniref:Serine/threonine-protein kinase TOR n=1 Tax=Cyprideis torosa TaxID=163714 RepID=A0A7R8ZRI1_9CRUS|nr:unnamed protein product [Cyprideis torosa]CAG0893117.1 unnamed protein product [Cyprideis torosa]
MMHQEQVNHILQGLRAKTEDAKLDAAKELHIFVTSELQEDATVEIFDLIDQQIYSMLSSPHSSDHKGAILAINALIGAEIGNKNIKTSRFANYLKNQVPSTDQTVRVLTAQVIAKLVLVSGFLDFGEHEMLHAFEWLEDKNEGRRHAGVRGVILRKTLNTVTYTGFVLLICELSAVMPTFFYQHINKFFDAILLVLWDSKSHIREDAASALRQALAIMAYREKKDKHLLPSGWYEQCFKQAAAEFEDAIGSLTPKEKNAIRDNRVHGALLVFNELLRLSNSSFEEERDALLQAHAAFSCIRQDRWRRDMRVVGSSSRRFPPTSSTAIASPNSSRALRQFHSHRRSGSATTPFLSPLRSQPDAALLLSAALVSGPDNDRYPFLPAGMGGKFLESTVCTDVVKHHYDIICQRVVAQKGNKNSFVQSTFLLLIPRLAAFNKRRFRDNHLEEILTHLLSLLKRERIPAAFAALGLTAVALGEDITPHLSQIVEVIRFCLPSLAPVPPPSSRRKTTSTSSLVDNHADPSVVACLAQVCHAVGPSLRDDVKELLKPCLKLGLSSVLTASLKEIAVQIPELKQLVSENLLTILSTILTAAPECSPESSSSLRSPTPPTSPSSVALIFGPSGEGHGPQLGASEPANIVLALKTLSTFDFEARSLLPYVDLLANDLTSSSHKSIRQEALRACTRILQPNLSLAMSSQTVFLKISDAVKKLLRAGLTDTDPDIRLCTLECLQEPFDTHLAQAECISLLFMAKHDQVFEIREHALCALGRLSTRNPALVMPKLRITLIQLLSELEFSLGRSREQAASLLGRLVSYSPALIEPYIEGILTFLTPRLKEGDCNPAVISKILLCIGELAQVNGAVIERHEKALYPILIEMIQDSSAGQKRLMALWTLGQVVQSTGKVVEPYLEYPHLTDILLVILKTENTLRIRRETIRVLGLLGALDPYRAVSNKNEIDPHCMADDETDSESQADMTTNEMLVSMNVSSNSLDEFYPAVTLSTVTRILRDPSQAQQNVVQAISFTFKSIGLKCVPYLPQVLPPLLNLIRTGDPPFKEFLFQHLGKLISIVGQHIRNYVDGIFALIIEFWNISGTYGSPQSDRMRGTIINLLEQIYGALGSEFKVYMPKVLPLILKTLQTDSSKDRSVTLKLLQTLSKCAPALESYLHMLLPPIVRLTETSDCSNQVRKQALDTITDIAGCLDLTEYPSTLIHPLVRVLDHQPELRNAAMEVLCSLGVQLGHRFQLFVPLIARAITRNKINHQKYEHLVSWIKKNDSLEDLPMFCRPRLPRTRAGDSDSDATPIKDKGIVLAALRNAWKVNRQASKEDWIVWLHRLSTELLKASPSPSLRACIALIPHYPMILRDLFNAAFVSCWLALDETSKSELMSALEVALAVQDVPELTQTILNLAEFMEHCDKGPLPLDPTLLGKHAMAVQAYAKALHYKEAEFHRQPTKTTETVGALISINHKLQQKEAAAGLLSFAMRNLSQDLRVEEKWYEKLHDWESALEAYQRKQELSPDDPSLTLGQMRCLQALGEWGGSSFFTVQLIDLARDLIDSELTSMISESYQRGYETLVTVVMLSELEEAVMYKLVPKKRSMIKWIWSKRLEGCRRSVEDWQRLLQVRSLVLSPREDMQTWLKFASLCRKSGRPLIADKTLMMLRECTKNDPVAAAKVTYASTKLMWSSNRKADALK